MPIQNQPLSLSPSLDAEIVSENSPDLRTIGDAYMEDIYDPRRDVRNKYPLIAQQILMNPVYREQLKEVANEVCVSGMYGYKNNEQSKSAVFMVALEGFAMGFDITRALKTIKVIHGQPTIRGPQALHLIRERTKNATLECVRGTKDECVWFLGRPNAKPKEFIATRDQVNAAGLPQKNDLWSKYPERLLKWHAFSEGAQELFGDVLMGCYISEEMDLEAQYERDLDTAISQDAAARGGRGIGRPAQKPTRKEQRPAEQHPGRVQQESHDPNRPSPEQIKTLVKKLSELTEANGGKFPVEGTDGYDEAKVSWDKLRTALWEDVSKAALDGKVAKRESLTIDEFNRMLKEFRTRIEMAEG